MFTTTGWIKTFIVKNCKSFLRDEVTVWILSYSTAAFRHSSPGSLFDNTVFYYCPQGGVNIGVEVWDDDDGKLIGELDDLIDKYSLNFKQPAEQNKDSAYQHHYVLRGQQSSFSIIVKVYCDSTYLIPSCKTPCVARDDELGHFMCNYTAGQKVCLEGWWDIAANCTKKKRFCERQNDTVMGHYECNPVSGAKICHDGWTGKNCTEGKTKLQNYYNTG